MDKKEWGNRLQDLKAIIRKPGYFEEAKSLILALHSMVYRSEALPGSSPTFEDEVWEGVTDDILRNNSNNKGRTILYGMWHTARIEDITMNLLVADRLPLFESGGWQSKINTKMIHTGNSLDGQQIKEFSQTVDIEQLMLYRTATAKNSREIINSLAENDFKRKVYQRNLKTILDIGAVDNVESANWLIDFWGCKDVAGIILMPCLRHQLVHINESLQAKASKKRI